MQKTKHKWEKGLDRTAGLSIPIFIQTRKSQGLAGLLRESIFCAALPET